MSADSLNQYFHDPKIMLASSFPSCKATKIDEINLMLDFDIC